MIQYRVTKYDPKHRDASGVYTRNEWHLAAQIGDVFDYGEFTATEYVTVENAYINAVMAFLSESQVSSLSICSLENTCGFASPDLPLQDGYECTAVEIADVARLVLRERIWCRLVCEDAFVHFGWDCYLYIGVPVECPVSIESCVRAGLFVELFDSPYLEA